MATQISPGLEKRISALIASGHFSDADDVLSQAVRLLESREERTAWLRAAIAEAEAEIERGEFVIYSEELMDELEQEAHERFLRGERPSPDVCP